MTEQEQSNFYHSGRAVMTEIGKALTHAAEYKEVFDARNGAIGVGSTYGADVELMIGAYNVIANALATTDNGFHEDVINRFRVDY